MSEEREDALLHLNESTARNQQSVGADFSVEEDSSESSIRPVSVELPHAIYSSTRQGSSTRTARRTSSSRFEQSPPQTFRSLARERGGHRRINMEGIAEVPFQNTFLYCSSCIVLVDRFYVGLNPSF